MLPPAPARALHAAIPGAKAASTDAPFSYTLPCDVSTPVSIAIGGKAYALDPAHLAYAPTDADPTICFSSIAAMDPSLAAALGSDNVWLLGVPFLRSVRASSTSRVLLTAQTSPSIAIPTASASRRAPSPRRCRLALLRARHLPLAAPIPRPDKGCATWPACLCRLCIRLSHAERSLHRCRRAAAVGDWSAFIDWSCGLAPGRCCNLQRAHQASAERCVRHDRLDRHARQGTDGLVVTPLTEQDFTLSVETGSNTTWVGSESCTGCNVTSSLDPDTSSTLSTSNVSRSVSYSTGIANGSVAFDVARFGAAVVPKIYLLQAQVADRASDGSDGALALSYLNDLALDDLAPAPTLADALHGVGQAAQIDQPIIGVELRDGGKLTLGGTDSAVYTALDWMDNADDPNSRLGCAFMRPACR